MAQVQVHMHKHMQVCLNYLLRHVLFFLHETDSVSERKTFLTGSSYACRDMK